MASKPQNLHKAPPTGPRRALIAPKWRLVGLVTQTNWIDVKTVYILVVFKIYRTSKSNNWSFNHNNLIKNPILFCKYLSPLKSHRNGFVFKIYIWISVFRRKKQFENPMLGCWDICKINTAPFFFKHPVFLTKPTGQSKTSSLGFVTQAGAATLLLVNLGRGLIGVGRCWYCRSLV